MQQVVYGGSLPVNSQPKMTDTVYKIDTHSTEYIQFQRNLDRNLSSIKANLPELYTRLIESVVEYVDLCLYKTPNGKYGISFRKLGDIDELFMWVSCEVEIKTQALRQVKQSYQGRNVYLVCGVDDGDLLSFLFQYSEQGGVYPNMLVPIYVLEEEIFLFRIFLMLHDVTQLIISQRVFFFVGEDVRDQFNHYINHHSFVKLPNTYIVNHLYQNTSLASDISKSCTVRTEYSVVRTQALMKNLNAYYNQRNLADWQKIFSSHRERALRVLGLTTRYSSFLQYCMRDWLQGFEEAGCQTKLLREPNDASAIIALHYLEAIDELKPDVILLLDHVRDECKYIPKNIPCVCWVQDMLPNLIEDRGYQLSAFDFTYVLASRWIETLKKTSTFSTANIRTLTLGCNTDVYYPIIPVDKDIDVLYVTHMYDPAETFYPFRYTDISIKLLEKEAYLMNRMGINIEQLAMIFDNLRHSIDKLSINEMTVFFKNRCTLMKTFVHNALIGSSVEQFSSHVNLISHLSESSSRFYYDLILRTKFLPMQYLIHHGINVVFFGKNWEKLPDCKKYAKGVIENGEALNQVMNRTKICINNSGEISFHMRAIEIMASQSFMLSRRIPDDATPLLDDFEENHEVVFFEDERNLLKKIDYYLSHENERGRIAKNAYQKVVEKFSYKEVAKRIIYDIGMNIK